MSDEKGFYRTELKVIVLSEEPYTNADDLEQVAYDITEGGCVGDVDVVSSEQLDGRQMVEALLNAGSDSSFFGLDEHGDPVD